MGLRTALNIISSYCQQGTDFITTITYTRIFLPKNQMKLYFDKSESFIDAGHSIFLCTYSS